MVSVRFLPLILLGSAAFLPAAGALAQEAEETVPKELALALLCRFSPTGEESVELRVGTLPDDLPADLVPANARILGSMVQSRGSTVVAVVPEAPDQALASYRADRMAEGWEAPPMGPRGGFVYSASTLPAALCRDETYLAAAAAPWREGRTLLSITLSRDATRTPCDAEMRRAERFPLEPVALPALTAPSGAVQRPTGGSAGNDHNEAVAAVESPLGAAELSAHYLTQLEREGWSLEEKVVGEDLALHRLRWRDDEGKEWAGVLVATAVSADPRRYDLVFRAVDPSAVRF